MVEMGEGGRGKGDVRVVDEDVEGAAGDFGDFGVAGLDALGVGDVEREGAHAHFGKVGQDRGPTRRGDDMEAYRKLAGFEVGEEKERWMHLWRGIRGQVHVRCRRVCTFGTLCQQQSSMAIRDVIPGNEDAFLAWLGSHLSCGYEIVMKAKKRFSRECAGVDQLMNRKQSSPPHTDAEARKDRRRERHRQRGFIGLGSTVHSPFLSTSPFSLAAFPFPRSSPESTTSF